MLVVLEGLDGAGKSTQLKRLGEYLGQKCPALEHIHFPRYDAPVYGELISRFLRGDFGSMESVHPQLVALLYAEDRHGAAPMLREKLDRGVCVLLDRYVYSNIAYQCAKVRDKSEAERLRDWILRTEFGDFGLPRPDLNIFMDVPISFVESNLHSQRQGDDRDYLEGGRDIHEADISFQRRVREMYLEQHGRDSNFTVVDCSGEDGRMAHKDVISARLLDVVKKKFNFDK
ncbi:MAG: thymidylate kinase [Bacteroidia bacterium]|nr:thymidylate kinase [Bacteroidia bacterium]